jgi:hypothetical protein
MRQHRPKKKRLKKKPKTAYELGVHTLRRALRRYKIILDAKTRRNIINQIQNGQAQFIEHWSKHRTIWKITVEGKALCVVYDKRFKEIATVLHPNDSRTKINLG